jgi:acyl-CoA thioesterase-1
MKRPNRGGIILRGYFMVERTKLKFVALGDSLTVGFTPYNPSQPMGYCLPYTGFLEEILAEELPRRGLNHVEVSFVNRGVNGDNTQGMLQRFKKQVIQEDPDYVIVWGGINDIFEMRPTEDIMRNLKQIYERTREIGADPIACTVTSIVHQNPVVPRIWELNDLIKAYCAENRILLVDLFKETSDELGLLMEGYSSDGVHLNDEGNRRIASAVYTEFVEQIIDGLVR